MQIGELWGVDMFKVQDTKFSEMKNKAILDQKGQKIGRVVDFHFKFDAGKIELKSIVMGGGRIEEFLESVGLRADIDPFFAINQVDRFEDDQLYLNVEYEKLDKPVELGKNEMRFTDLCKCTIIDSDTNKIGKINDVVFDEKSRPWFVIGGGFFEEFSERVGLRPDIDLLVPQEYVAKLSSDTMNIKYSKYQLTTTAQQDWEQYKRDLTAKPELATSPHQFIWLSEPGGRPFR